MLTILQGVDNQVTRDAWVSSRIRKRVNSLEGQAISLLDAGAGQQPYRSLIESLGVTYKSHDFNSYVPKLVDAGLHTEEWPHLEHDYVCDLLDLPVSKSYDIVLCTEVLEHVPDPVAAITHLAKLVRPSGYLIVTAPLLSLIHQAPYHFSSGLTPFWYQHWLPKNNLEIVELAQHGDYADLLSQEFRRLSRLPGIIQKPLAKLIRPFISRETANSGGFSVFVCAKKI
jgi:2-polyprenyl-3-methyl-5-hydroxy-6-metoxy-1,4-benzoquinol methylase